jgi:tRNA-Thr(GGU) m(6)t(6)A37 methyltransferase TsaA
MDHKVSQCRSGSLNCLDEYSHIWVLFHFHDNTDQESSTKAKVLPPRKKKGGKVGVFCCRTPHRPNAIGLSLVRVVGVDEKRGLVHISGVDIIDGTPVIDIKPFIPAFDNVFENVKISAWCAQTSDLSPDFMNTSISQRVRDKLESCVVDLRNVSARKETKKMKIKKSKLGTLLSIYEGNVNDLYVTLLQTVRWDQRKQHSNLDQSSEWLFRLGDWDFGVAYAENEATVFDCWHLGEVVFDSRLGKIVALP